MRKWLVGAIDWLARAASILAMLCLIVIVVGITADATGRYLLAKPIEGVQAIVEGLLQPAMIFLGCGLVARMDGHMKVTVFRLDRWPTARSAIDLAFKGMIGVFWGIVAWQAAARAYAAYVSNQWPVGEIAVPAIVSYGIVAVGAALACLAHILPVDAARAQNS